MIYWMIYELCVGISIPQYIFFFTEEMQLNVTTEQQQERKDSYSKRNMAHKGSKNLLQFFQSEEFTPELLIHYYIATFNEPGPHQFLTNKLYYMPNKFVEDYIP
jgi:hypothetical protein